MLKHDPGSTGLQSVPEFGSKTVAVLRAELGDVDRFQRTDQVIAYGSLDIAIKQSGKWQGKAKLSKRGSGQLPRLVFSRCAQCPTERLGLWGVLPSLGGAWHEEGNGPCRRDAQNAGGGGSLVKNGGGL